ncbi:transcriptional repressor RstR [Vibrio cholerae HC-43A1]|nr:transcriptional repressor RstR [Vibrio cholerae HC-43A1]
MNYAEDGPQMKIKSLCSRLKKIQQLDEEEQKAISMVLESMLIRHSTKSILNHGA